MIRSSSCGNGLQTRKTGPVHGPGSSGATPRYFLTHSSKVSSQILTIVFFFGFQLDSSSWTGWKIPSSVETTLRELCLLAAGRRCLYVLSLLHIFILLIFRVLRCRSSRLLSGSADLGRAINPSTLGLCLFAGALGTSGSGETRYSGGIKNLS